MFVAATFPSTQQSGSQDYICLITNSFFNDFASIIHYSSKMNSTFLDLFDMLLICDWPFLHACILQVNLLFSTLILGSVFSEYVVFYGDAIQSANY